MCVYVCTQRIQTFHMQHNNAVWNTGDRDNLPIPAIGDPRIVKDTLKVQSKIALLQRDFLFAKRFWRIINIDILLYIFYRLFCILH